MSFQKQLTPPYPENPSSALGDDEPSGALVLSGHGWCRVEVPCHKPIREPHLRVIQGTISGSRPISLSQKVLNFLRPACWGEGGERRRSGSDNVGAWQI